MYHSGTESDDDWKEKQQKAVGIIAQGLEREIRREYIDEQYENPKVLWDKIKADRQEVVKLDSNYLRKELYDVKLEELGSVHQYVDRINSLIRDLVTCGFTVSDEEKYFFVLNGLPSEWNTLKMVLQKTITNQKEWRTLVTQLEQYEADLKREKGLSDDTLLFTKSRSNNRNNRSSNNGNNGNNRRTNTSNIECFHCGKKGHKKFECRKLKREQEKGTGSNDSGSSNTRGSAAMALDTLWSLIDNDTADTEDTAHTADTADMARKVSEQNQWVLDSGSTNHITGRRDNFISGTFKPIKRSLEMADRTTVEALGIGNVRLRLYNPEHELTLQNVLYLPQSGNNNLLSMHLLAEKGITAKMDNKNAQLYRGKTLQATLRKINRLYVLEGHTIKPEETAMAATTNDIDDNKDNNNARKWHQRLGHAPARVIQAIPLELAGTVSTTTTKTICESCIMGKFIRKPFQLLQRRATRPLELVHTDLCGPMETTSTGGARYFMTFIDDYSRYKMVYFLKKKSEAFDKFKEMKAYTENLCGHKILRIKSDNGTEYTSNAFAHYLTTEGIQAERTTPYTPQQNGVAERANRTLITIAKCMMHQAHAPRSMWAEAVRTATYLHNITPSAVLDDKSPWELWRGGVPIYSHLRIWGCVTYAQLPKEKRKKWDDKASKCMFIGYTLTTKQYRLYNPISRTLIISRDVEFDENRMYYGPERANIELGNDNTPPAPSLPAPAPVSESESDDKTPEPPMAPEATPEEPEDIPENLKSNLGPYWKPPAGKRGSKGSSNKDADRVLMVREGPPTYEEAMETMNASEWQESVDSELDSHHSHGTWIIPSKEEVDKANNENATIITARLVLQEKLDENGQTARRKARLVAQGFKQRPGIDYLETYSPLISVDAIRMLLSYGAANDLEIDHLDVVTAYLESSIKEVIYLMLPACFTVYKGRIVRKDSVPASNARDPNIREIVRLCKSIYGLKQSARNWYRTSDAAFVQKLRLKRCKYEAGIYYGRGVILMVWVDDICIMGNRIEVDKIKEELGQIFSTKDLGAVHHLLGMAITRDRKTRTITLGQQAYIEKTLETFGMENANAVTTPLAPGTNMTKSNAEKPKVNQTEYQAMVGSTQYAAIMTKPEAAYAAGVIGRYASNPSDSHRNSAKRILRYLQGTKHMVLRLGRVNDHGKHQMEVFADADFAGDVDDRKSTSGYVIFDEYGAAISWKSKKQSIIAQSTSDAEFTACATAGQQAQWLQLTLEDIGINKPAILIRNDNMSTIANIENGKYKPGSRHVGVKYHWLREAVETKDVAMSYCATNDMIADVFTKPLAADKLTRFRHALGVIDPAEGEC